ncbi:MAG: IS21 family transposase, partial [Desulfobacterales bacterium]
MEEDMGFKKITTMEIYEIIRRWHNKQSIRHISKVLGYDRKTVRKLINSVTAKGIALEKPLPTKDQMIALLEDAFPKSQRPAKTQQILQPFLPEIVELVNNKSMPLKPKTAFEVITARHNLTVEVSYSSFKRFVRANSSAIIPHKSGSTCRIEVPAGNEVQIDYARMGLLFDPITHKNKVVYAFIGTLSYSRHKYVEFVYTQNQQSFIASNVAMYEYFGGVPDRINLDNLKTGVIKPDLYDPQFNRAFQEFAEYYHCFIDPSRVAHPKDKGKVERDVQTIREQFRKLIALYPGLDIQHANRMIKKWCIEQYGQREHGTTHLKPYPTFIEFEKPALKPLPLEAFEIAQWKEATVHPDHYIQFNKKAYSVPSHQCNIGAKVWVRGTHKLVQIYHQNILIQQHIVTSGYRHTDFNDFPPNVKAALDEGLPLHLQLKAKEIGPHFQKLVRTILKPHAFINLRKAQAIVGLAGKCNPALLEQAATFILEQKISITPKDFKRLLENLDQQNQPQQQLPISEQTAEFIRDI